MNNTEYKDLIELINQHSQWATIVNEWNENKSNNSLSTNQLKELQIKFRIENQTKNSDNIISIWEWDLQRALIAMEVDIKFKHRRKMHACTPDDADQWLQIAVFGYIIFK